MVIESIYIYVCVETLVINLLYTIFSLSAPCTVLQFFSVIFQLLPFLFIHSIFISAPSSILFQFISRLFYLLSLNQSIPDIYTLWLTLHFICYYVTSFLCPYLALRTYPNLTKCNLYLVFSLLINVIHLNFFCTCDL